MTTEQRERLAALLETVTDQDDIDFLKYLTKNMDTPMSRDELEYFNEIYEAQK